jgi:hypothetical protein
VESLESRSLLSATPGLARSLTGTADPADTLNAATALGDLSTVPSVRVDAAIGDSPAGAADVDWYAFTLDRPATVTLAATGAAAQPPVLGLYARDPFDPGDPATLFGVRQLTQAAGTDPVAGTVLTRALAAGSYYLAASGAGNLLFSPLVAASGYDGLTGSYHLQLTAADLGLSPTDGPTVLASDPAAGSSLDRSPTVFRLDLSAPIDPTTVLPGDDVSLTYNRAGTFGDAKDHDVPLATFHFSDATTELQLTPAAPLAPGYYRLRIAGDSGANADVLTGADGTPLGTNTLHPSGQDFALTFRVAGVEGNTAPGAGADDTPAGAHNLGDVSDGRIVHAAGVIGGDPTDPVPFDASDVDLYHFHISGPGRYAFAAEVFAQRIDSPLNAAASLFVKGPDGHLHLLAGNDDSQNPTQATDHRSLPLFADPVVFAGLTAGDYYLAVSSKGNVPDPNHGLLPGTGGIFDPAVSHSGKAGRSTGNYVLNLRATADNVPPHVVAVTPAPGDSLAAAPAYLTVQFDAPVILQQLAYQAYQGTSKGIVASVYVRGADGARYYPRLQSYDPATGLATFLMLDRLPAGASELHLSGPLGLTDFAGNPLVGNDPSGDYVTHFTVGAPPVGSQDLGILFPHELEGTGYRITGNGAAGYHFQVLQAQNYFFLVDKLNWPAGLRLTLKDASGAAVVTKAQADRVSLQGFLKPGAYVVQVAGWTAAAGPYSLRVVLGGSAENPQPLTLGPSPVLRLSLTPAPAGGPVTTPRVDLPAGATQPATTSTSNKGTVTTAANSSPGAPVEAPSGLLAALGVGPVGGVGAGTVGQNSRTPLLALTGLDGVASRDPARSTSDYGTRLSGAARDALAGAQDAAARLIDWSRWLGTFLDKSGLTTDGKDVPKRPDEARPVADEQDIDPDEDGAPAGAEISSEADSRAGTVGPADAACLAALLGAAWSLSRERTSRVGSDRAPAGLGRGRKAEGEDA